MRILFFTDTHIRGNTPRNRLDDFPETVAAKLREVIHIVHERNVDLAIHGGDLFDLPNPALGTAREFLKILRELETPLYLVPGNHDMFGYNAETLNRSIVGLAADLGLFTLMQAGQVYEIAKDGLKLHLSACPFHYELDRREPQLDYCVKKKDCDVAIHVVHGMLVQRPLFAGAAYTLIEKILTTEADVTLAGHNHLGFPTLCIEGKWFSNPGALVRLENHTAEMSRMPSVLLIEIDGEIRLRTIQLKSARPGEQVLDRSKLEAEQYRAEKLAGFLQLVRQTSSFETVDLQGIVQQIAELHGVSSEVARKALELLAKAEESMKEGIDPEQTG
ncbi:MAG TPA: serine/threonine protein phosphatase [Firmicutes bacterium]|nr:serine/threonine protein phosphatase [Bacillota bacterium]